MKKATQKRKKRGTRKKASSPSNTNLVSTSDVIAVKAKEDTKKKVSPPVSRRESEGKGEKKTSVFRYIGIAGQFLRESKLELKKVKWPTRKELLASTAVVIVLVLVIALFLGLIDFGLIKIIKNIVG